MAAARVQFGNGQNSAGGSYQVVLPAGTTNGNLLMVAVGSYDPTFANFVQLANVTDNNLSQYAVVADAIIGGNNRITFFYIPGVSAGVKTVTVTTNVPSTAVVTEYSGLVNQIDVVGSPLTDSSGSTSWTTSTIVNSSASGLISCFSVAISLVGAAYAAGASYTLVVEQDDSVNGTSSALFERLNAASQTSYNSNGTVGSVTRVDSMQVAFK